MKHYNKGKPASYYNKFNKYSALTHVKSAKDLFPDLAFSSASLGEILTRSGSPLPLITFGGPLKL